MSSSGAKSMKVAFLNLCHCDSRVVARVANKLTANKNFDMYIHVDQKSDQASFLQELGDNPQVYFIKERQKVYWGGFNAVKATIALLEEAYSSPNCYDYYVLLQNLDYPIRSNAYIEEFFTSSKGVEFIRGCNIARTRDWHFARKYKIYNQRDDDFYLKKHTKLRKFARYLMLGLKSFSTFFSNGVIWEHGETFDIYYGTAQWAVTRSCAKYIMDFYKSHPAINKRMAHVQFPDEEYFHTAVHNSPFKYNCVKFDEPEQRWLVNWRNLHYFEYPREVTVLEEKDYEKIMSQDALFIRKVRTGISDKLMARIDAEADRL